MRCSAADLAAVTFCDHNKGRAWPTTGIAVREGTELLWVRWVRRLIVGPFAGMLNANEHRPLVRRDHDTGSVRRDSRASSTSLNVSLVDGFDTISSSVRAMSPSRQGSPMVGP
jgi:hypothetical protein